VTAPPLLIVRHASAGDRGAWPTADHLRPIDARGHLQAAELVETLAGYGIDRILTSPYVRCVETVEPLAQARSLEVEHTDALAEGAGATVGELLRSLRGSAAVLCSHGDVIGDIVGYDRKCKKGSVWVMEWDGDVAVPTHYIKPQS
jgi:8-oxo-dGTP diphosphatase